MAFDTPSDNEQNSRPAPGKGHQNIEQLFNTKQNFSFGDLTFNAGQSRPPNPFPFDPFMGHDGEPSALLDGIPTGLTPGALKPELVEQ